MYRYDFRCMKVSPLQKQRYVPGYSNFEPENSGLQNRTAHAVKECTKKAGKNRLFFIVIEVLIPKPR